MELIDGMLLFIVFDSEMIFFIFLEVNESDGDGCFVVFLKIIFEVLKEIFE